MQRFYISRQTLYRRLDEFEIDTYKFTEISDSDLDSKLQEIKSQHPTSGETMIQGQLLHRGIKVPRAKLCESIHCVDHANTVNRHSSVIKRRIYSTPHPNSVWNLNGNHKMIRWKLIIHAGIDGFSRLITYINCANNNLASTVLEQFLKGVSVYGLPVSGRTDHGGENIDVWRHMLLHYHDLSCIVTSSSVHNKRIERLWRDVTRCVSSTYIALFNELETDGLLNPDNEVDIFCLQLVFLPCINKCLTEFQGSWNNHPLSTEGNMSPLQLYFTGFVASDHQTSSTNASTLHQASVDFNLDDLESVEVPCNKFEPCDQLLQVIYSEVDLAQEAVNDGKTLYQRVIHLIGQHLLGHCSGCKLN